MDKEIFLNLLKECILILDGGMGNTADYKGACTCARREGIHSSKVSVAIRRGLRNMRRCYDDLFQAE